MSKSLEARNARNRACLVRLSPKVLLQLHEIELEAFAKFNGTADEFESALGFLHLGFQVGWKPLALIHSKATVRKYEKILGINVRELFPEETPASDRNTGYAIAKKLSNFWKVVSGEVKIENKRDITSL